MDKEAQEKIKNYAAKWFDRGREYGNVPITKNMLAELEEDGEKLLTEFGYHKPPKDKPPLLSPPEQLEAGFKWNFGIPFPDCWWIERAIEGVAQAQREADIKHYEEVSNNIC